MRIVLVVRDQALRIASAVVRALDFAERVSVINLDCDDETARLAEEIRGEVIQYSGPTNAPSIAKILVDSTRDTEHTVIIALDRIGNCPTWREQWANPDKDTMSTSHSSTEQKIANQSMTVKVCPSSQTPQLF